VRRNESKGKLRVANRRLEVIKLALSPLTGKLALVRIQQAGVAGRKEASEIGRKKAQGK
jgi:hypothetical protein